MISPNLPLSRTPQQNSQLLSIHSQSSFFRISPYLSSARELPAFFLTEHPQNLTKLMEWNHGFWVSEKILVIQTALKYKPRLIFHFLTYTLKQHLIFSFFHFLIEQLPIFVAISMAPFEKLDEKNDEITSDKSKIVPNTVVKHYWVWYNLNASDIMNSSAL